MRMTRTSLFIVFCGTCLVPGSGCSDGEESELEQWLGSEPHFEAHGIIGGSTFDISLRGADAQNQMALFCSREYVVPDVADPSTWSNAVFDEVEITIDATLFPNSDAIRTGLEQDIAVIELELKRHDLQSDAPGTAVEIIPRDDLVPPPPNQAWLELEVTNVAGDKFLESAAVTGTYTLELFTGQPDSSGVVIPSNQGVIGAFFSARWSTTDELVGSYSVACGENGIRPQ